MPGLGTKLDLKSAQADITAAFVHAKLRENDDIFVQHPTRGHEREDPNGERLVLKLNRAVCGLCQSPRYFFETLAGLLDTFGLRQSDQDPCLFVGRKEERSSLY